MQFQQTADRRHKEIMQNSGYGSDLEIDRPKRCIEDGDIQEPSEKRISTTHSQNSQDNSQRDLYMDDV